MGRLYLLDGFISVFDQNHFMSMMILQEHNLTSIYFQRQIGRAWASYTTQDRIALRGHGYTSKTAYTTNLWTCL